MPQYGIMINGPIFHYEGYGIGPISRCRGKVVGLLDGIMHRVFFYYFATMSAKPRLRAPDSGVHWRVVKFEKRKWSVEGIVMGHIAYLAVEPTPSTKPGYKISRPYHIAQVLSHTMAGPF